MDAVTAEQAALIEADERQRSLRLDAEHILFKREATRLADALEARDTRRPIIRTLGEELALPDDPEVYAIDGLLPVGGNALFAGQYKAGKSTFNNQLMKSWADGVPFLGRYRCNPDPERRKLVLFNYELSEGQYRRWLRKIDIENQDDIVIVQLRGISWPIGLEKTRKEMAKILRDHNAGMWVVDPASRAMAGFGDGDNNRDVNAFTAYLDEIKAESGTRDAVVPIHMGHSSAKDEADQRALGAQAWSAWADALWFVTRDNKGQRWFRATGRDVNVDRLLVQYNEADMSVRLAEHDPESVQADETEERENKVRTAVLRSIEQSPGITKNSLHDAVRAYIKVRPSLVVDIVAELLDSGHIETQPGTNRRTHHYLAGQTPPVIPGGSA